jgi:hypothetical protein
MGLGTRDRGQGVNRYDKKEQGVRSPSEAHDSRGSQGSRRLICICGAFFLADFRRFSQISQINNLAKPQNFSRRFRGFRRLICICGAFFLADFRGFRRL